jgi:selenocysteine-specific elongation factor
MYVIGTAGHVDHGKSTLVHALTGINPDRLREEQEREMTIDLGFAWLTLPDGTDVGIVDVPGHRDFIENMLAGVGGIDAALLVVAADEGVMPQTIEHLAILDLLGVEAGVVALTKADLAESEEWLELVTADISETLEHTVLKGAPVIPVSAHTGRGLDALVRALQETLNRVQPRPDQGFPRLPVDRVFTISGFGTIVTGTLTGGCFEVGQEVEIVPQGLRARVRGLQVHKHKTERAFPGSRVAINLSGVSKSDLRRGDVISLPGRLRPTTLIDVQLRYLPNVLRSGSGQPHPPLRHNTWLKFFSGTAETMARVRLLGREELEPGESGWAQLELREAIPLVKGDRFIVRIPSPPATVGGGVVVDPNPRRRHRRFRPEVTARLETLMRGSPAEILLQTLERSGPVTVGELLANAGLGEIASEALLELLSEGRAVVLTGSSPTDHLPSAGQLVASDSWWRTLAERCRSELSAYHQRFPLRAGMSREALRSGLKLEPRVFNAAMERASAERIIVEENALVRLSSHTVRLTPEQRHQANELLARFRQDPYTTPSFKESVAAVGEEVLGVLIGQGELVRVSADVLFLPETYEEIVSRIRAHITSEGSITLAQARDMFGTSRKYAQAILEHLDEIGVTKRVGDERILRSQEVG